MAMDISPFTNEEFYSGTWTNIKEALKVLKIGDAKLDGLKVETVNNFQERSDRYIDGILSDLYKVPFKHKKKVNRAGTVMEDFPGDIRQCAIYYTCYLLMSSEFQGVSQNVNEQTNSFKDDAEKMLFSLKKNNHWVPGAERKSHISRTMPPTWQPAYVNQPM
jgi:hypothetical protein